eukprot:2121329-Rhodomonas_salina.1
MPVPDCRHSACDEARPPVARGSREARAVWQIHVRSLRSQKARRAEFEATPSAPHQQRSFLA